MNFFEKRPLSIILCILLGGFSLFILLPVLARWIVFGIAAAFLIACIVFVRKIGRFPSVAALSLLISFALSLFYFQWYFPIYNRFADEESFEGRVSSVVYSESFEALATVKVSKIGDMPITAKLLISYHPNAETASIGIGDGICFRGKIRALAEGTYGFDEKQYYEARGVQGFVEDARDVAITKGTEFSIAKFIETARETLNAYIERSADPATAGLLCALITGEKSTLPGSVRLSFGRIGLSHILALSGMHLAILTTGLHKLLSLFTLDKKWRCGLSMLFVIAYMGIAGFPVSILRAGGMLLISNLLFLFAKTKDSFTNLLISVTIICAFSPYAVHDISLLLSFFATVGVLVSLQFLEAVPYHISRIKKMLIAIGASLLVSFFAIALTLPFSVFTFGRLSWIAPITTLIFSILVEIFIYAGVVFLILGAPPLLLSPLSWLCSQIASLAKRFSDIPSVYTVAEDLFTQVCCILFYALLLAFIVLKIRRKRIFLSALTAVFICVFLFSYMATQSALKGDSIAFYSDTKNKEAILATDDEKHFAVSLTDSTRVGGAYFTYLLTQENVLTLEHLWIPQYQERLPLFLSEVLASLPVYNLYFPAPKNNAESVLLDEAERIASEYGCIIHTVKEGESTSLQDTKIHSVYRAKKEDGFRLILSLQKNDSYYTYISKGAIAKKNEALAHSVISSSDTVIFGCNGASTEEVFYIEEISEKTDCFIFETEAVGITNPAYESSKDRVKFYYKPKAFLLNETP